MYCFIDASLPAYQGIGDINNARLCYKKAIKLDLSASYLLSLTGLELRTGNTIAALECLNAVKGLEMNENLTLLFECYLKRANAQVKDTANKEE